MCVSLFPKGNLKSIRCTQICWNGEFHLRVSSSTSTNENAWHFHHLNTFSTITSISSSISPCLKSSFKIHHFPPSSPAPLESTISARLSNLGTYITTWWWLGSGEWRGKGFLMSPTKNQERTEGKFLREVSYVTPCNIYQIELIEIPDNFRYL